MLAVMVATFAPVSASGQSSSNEQFNASANGAPEDLHKYLGPGGRFIDRCAYEKDHPNANTLIYGQPDHFPPHGPMGNTVGVNGSPAPYVSCALDSCPPNGFVCWRNPAAGKPAQLQRRGCRADGTGTGYCPPKSNGEDPPGSDPCKPFGSGGYNFCDNPRGTALPRGCYCSPPGAPTAGPPPPAKRPADPNQPLVDTLKYTAGFVDGIGQCVQGLVDIAAAAGWMARGVADLAAPAPVSLGSGVEFVKAAELLGVQPGQSMVLRQIAAESRPRVLGQRSNAFDAASAGGRRLCAFGIIPGIAKAAKGVKSAPRAPTPGSAPSRPLDGPTLQGTVSSDGTAAAALRGTWIGTPGGPVQLGNYVGKGTFGAVYEVAGNPGQVVKIGTNNPFAPQSFANQVSGSKLLQKAGIPTANITRIVPPANGQPPLLFMDNTFQAPGAFQATTGGLKRTQLTIGAKNETIGSNGAVPTYLTPAETDAVHAAMQQLNDRIAGHDLIFADNHLGNVVFVPKVGGLSAVIVDADFVVTRPQLLQQLGGRTGAQLLQDLANGKPIPSIADVMLPVLEQGGGLDALGPNLTAAGVMNALSEARQRINNPYAAGTPAGGGTPYTPTVAPRPQ